MTLFVGFVTLVDFLALVAIVDHIRTGKSLPKDTHWELSFRVLILVWGSALLVLEFFGGGR